MMAWGVGARGRARRGDRYTACGASRKGSRRSVVCTKTVAARLLPPGDQPGGEGEGGRDPAAAEALEAKCEALEAAVAGSRRGLEAFAVQRDPFDAGVFHFWEHYRSVADFEAVLEGEAMVGFIRDVAGLLERPVGIALYEWVDGQLGAPMVNWGPKGEGGLDDATGANKFGGGASYEQTSGAVNLGSLDPEERLGGQVGLDQAAEPAAA